MENKSVLVCHYTSFEAFKNIIQTKKLFLSDYRDMNDSMEFIHARDVVRELFREKFDSIVKKYLEQKNESITCSKLDKYFEEMLCFIFNPDRVPMYLFCASIHEKDDNDGLLSMWRAYGKANDGIGIVLNLERDAQKLNAKLKYKKDLEQKDYDNLDQNKLNEFIKTLVIGNNNASLETSDVIGPLLDIAFTYKHPGFKDELEYRISYIQGDVKIRDKNKKEIRYIERYFDLSCIEKIIIGPSNQQTELHRKTQIVFEIEKLKIPIVDSRIPFLWDS